MQRLKFGEKKPGHGEAVFTAIMTESVQPWEFHYVKRVAPIKCPSMIIISRWDGARGFPGGFIDSGESIRDAAVRETMEEIGVEVDPDRLEDGYTFFNNISVHLVKLIVDEREFLEILQSAWIHSSAVLGDIISRKFYPEAPLLFDDMRDVNFFTEVNGVEAVYVTEIDTAKCFPRFLKSPFPPTMIEQMALLCRDHKWGDEETMIRWFAEGGHDYLSLIAEDTAPE
jgi:8-oxo-dGTP pyrophosphatase MutT (NUDIX family)